VSTGEEWEVVDSRERGEKGEWWNRFRVWMVNEGERYSRSSFTCS
jgi:hypothetical protein